VEGACFTGGFERQMKEGSGNGASLSLSLSLNESSVRGTWREGSYTEDSERHVIESSEKGAFHL